MLNLEKLVPVIPVLRLGLIPNNLIGLGTVIGAAYELGDQTLALLILFAISTVSCAFLSLVQYYQHRLGSEKKHVSSLNLLIGGFESSLGVTFLALHIANVAGSNSWSIRDRVMLMYSAFCGLIAW
jgi:hypothetical protein